MLILTYSIGLLALSIVFVKYVGGNELVDADTDTDLSYGSRHHNAEEFLVAGYDWDSIPASHF